MMSESVMQFLGDTKLELGPISDTAHPWQRGEADSVVWLALACAQSKVNTISRAEIEGLSAQLDQIEQDRPRAVIIRSAKLSGFAMGADIHQFEHLDKNTAEKTLRDAHAVLNRLEALPCPTIAVIHGAALGAGFEIALACDQRIAIEGASFGLPEVRLGLHPGLGGTVRLPSLVDPIEALKLMLTGKKLKAHQAQALGIVDEVIPERHVAAAVATMIESGAARKRGLKSRAFDIDGARKLAAVQLHRETEKKAPQASYPAPHRLINLWEKHGDDKDAMLNAEITSFADLLMSDTSKHLRRVFFLRQGLKEGVDRDDDIAHVHVIGAGAMGAEIAAWAAVKGKVVTLSDVKNAPLGEAIAKAHSVADGAKLSEIETRNALDRLVPDPNGYGLADADLVIEAGPESIEAKHKIYDHIASTMKEDGILVTNTSSLALSDLYQQSINPSRFAGLHFFNPVAKMQLVEVVSHSQTDADVRRRLAAFCGAIDRLPLQVREYPGFLVNRALTPYLLEAMVLMDEGISKEMIDSAAIAFGMPVGPVALADQVGLDVGLHVAESLKKAFKKPLPDLSERLRSKIESGDLGKKTGRGFYDWSKGTPRPEVDLKDAPDDLMDRLLLPMLDACVECLRQDIVGSTEEVDAAMIFATGFPPFLGGPMHYARTRGVQDIESKMTALADKHGDRFYPDSGWSALKNSQ